MRTWIWATGLLIAEAIRPNHEYSLTISIFMIVLGVSAMIMDTIEFKKKL